MGMQWWSYDLYHGPRGQKPKVFYCNKLESSERVAYYEYLMKEPEVIGFDLEWPCYNQGSGSKRLQDQIGSPKFAKAGVNILTSDFRRLREHFGLKPQGAIELSHLHNLVTIRRSGVQPGNYTTKLCSLEEQVKTHLGLPINKGSSTVRTSNWSRKYLTGEQKAYAASDAYASFMLYHCLNAARSTLEPVPPLPLWAERYEWFRHIPRRGTMLLLEMEGSGEDNKVITAADFFDEHHDNVHVANPSDPPELVSSGPSTTVGESQPVTPSRRRARNVAPATSPSQPKRGSKAKDDPGSRLLNKLRDSRARIAKQRRCEPFKIAQNTGSYLEEEAATVETPDALTEDSDSSGADEAAEPVTPAARPPQLHTGLTSVVQRIGIKSKGTKSEPIELDDTDEDGQGQTRGCWDANEGEDEDEDAAYEGLLSSLILCNNSPVLVLAPLHGIMQYFPPQRGGS
ncbi:hypothetical protein VMCG_00362 [Cytospora schulzeri]|uniref:3'-5' exonuclease domain-containing protein n=1 Tax=Cytospora schulzeri TaxID=448051 RepID=A0A423X8E4_9PEZI|nr:hypothetical protein VMCG_00362 [Valsa malicola]